jgi:hypothetical protein
MRSVGKQSAKGEKYRCRVRLVTEEKLLKLYKNTDQECVDCMYDCKNEIEPNKDCINKKVRMELNEIITLLKEENVNMKKLCDSYGLKLYILIEMLRGNLILNFKYYTAILDRLHMVKNSEEINKEYQQMKVGADV